MDYFDFLRLPDIQTGDGGVPPTQFTPALDTQLAITPVGTPAEHLDTASSLTVSVSTTFYPTADIDVHSSDLILISTNNVFFHAYRLFRASHNGFGGSLPLSTSSEENEEGISCTRYAPSFDTLSAALSALVNYGVSPVYHSSGSSPLFALLLAHAPTLPIQTYALAARHGLEEAAIAISPYLLSFSLPTSTDELAARIGPLYPKRLFFLHYDRMSSLKRLLLHPPIPHAPTSVCDVPEQKTLTRLWALASAQIVWDARPNLSTALLEVALGPLENELSCDLCKQSLRGRVGHLLSEWAAIKVLRIALPLLIVVQVTTPIQHPEIDLTYSGSCCSIHFSERSISVLLWSFAVVLHRAPSFLLPNHSNMALIMLMSSLFSSGFC